MQNNLQWGAWNAICDSCGLKFKSHELQRRWDGLMVCSKDYEQRHPQDFIRSKPEKNTVAYVRDEPAVDIDITPFCDIWNSSPMADFGVADCMTVGNLASIPILIDIYNPTCIAGYAIASRSIPGVPHV